MFGFGPSKPRVLHVDDNAESRALVQDILALLGYEAATAASALEGLKAAKARPPALILMDAMMPEMDGFDACQHLRRDPALASIPIIMMTSLERMADVEQAFAAGANDYLLKPVTVDRLREKLAKFLGPAPKP
ncbi:MAG: response regulator [Elusimicrobia bacterium]|nr:response regulator [Elusimicrobiota bacterium]